MDTKKSVVKARGRRAGAGWGWGKEKWGTSVIMSTITF